MKSIKIISVFILIVLVMLTIFLVLSKEAIQVDQPIVEEKPVVTLIEQLEENNEEIIETVIQVESEEIKALRERVLTFAIFAIDQREDEVPRSDIIMLLKYDIKNNNVSVVSTPRDTKVDIPGKFSDKINHAYAYGGHSLLRETLVDLYGISIDYYLQMSFKDFEAFINLIGGIEVTAVKDYEYDKYISIKAGQQILSGEEALDYVRFRYDEDGDFGRIIRQQEVVKELLDTIGEYGEDESAYLLDFYEYIETDLSFEELSNLYKVYDKSKQLQYDAYTLETRSKVINGIWYELYDEENLEHLSDVLKP